MSERSRHDRGLLFLCYVTSLENQLEFVQQRWVHGSDSLQPGSGIDTIIGSTKVKHHFLGAAPVSKDSGPEAATLNSSAFVEMQGRRLLLSRLYYGSPIAGDGMIARWRGLVAAAPTWKYDDG